MNVEMFNVGWATVPAGIIRAGDAMEEPLRFPVPAFLIETDTERILIDTGLHPERLESVGPFDLEQELSIADQVDLTTLTRVVLTHLHFDHAAGLSLIPATVPIVVQRSEWAAGHDDAAIERNFYVPGNYSGTDTACRARRRRPRPSRRRLNPPVAHPRPYARAPVGPDREPRARRRRRPFRERA